MEDDTESDTLELVVAMQDVMLPTGMPVLPSIDLSARFRLPAGAEEPVGNWLDVVSLPDGKAALVVGEAVGTGMAAAAAMGQVRAIIHAGLLGGDVRSAMQLAHAYAVRSADARGASLVIAVLDPVDRCVTYATAGHPGPSVLRADGVETLPPTGGAALGANLGTGIEVASTHVDPDDILVVTCPTATLGVRELGGSGEVGGLDDVADQLAVTLGGINTVAVIAGRLRTEARPRLDLTLERNPDAERRAREALQAWLGELDAPLMDQMALVHATAELVTNAVEHAGAHAPIGVHGWLDDGGVVVVDVIDHGRWQQPSHDIGRGRGLAMAAGLVDWLGVSSDDEGTRARVGHRLSRPVHIDVPTRSGVGLLDRVLDLDSSDTQTVVLRGEIANDDVERVAAELLIATRGGTGDIVVDLSQVTQLSSSAVRMFAELIMVHPVVGESSGHLRIRTPADSPAGRALEFAMIPIDAA